MDGEAALRLECLKLAHRHDLTPDTVIDRAKRYAEWCGRWQLSDSGEPARGHGRSRKERQGE
jgi:hypothetical protein